MSTEWADLRELVVYRLDRLDRATEQIEKDVTSIKSRVASLSTTAAIASAIAGVVGGAVVSAIAALLVHS